MKKLATVRLTTQRVRFQQGALEERFYQDVEINLVKTDGSWFVDKAIWK